MEEEEDAEKVNDLLTSLLAKCPLEELEAKWEKAALQQADNYRQNDRLGLEGFVGLIFNDALSLRNDGLNRDAVVELFRTLDVRGDGRISWDDFARFILDISMAADAPDGNSNSQSVPRPREYRRVGASFNDEFALQGLQSIVYLPPPLHKVLVIPLGRHSDVVHVISPLDPPRITGSMRHHTVYKSHRVVQATGVPETNLVITSSTCGISHLSLWTLPVSKHQQQQEKPSGPLIPVLLQRLDAPSEQSTLRYSRRFECLFTSGMEHGVVNEWVIVRTPDGVASLHRRRCLRLHSLGVSSIVEVERNFSDHNLLVTGSLDGVIRVWNPNDWVGVDSPTPPEVQEQGSNRAIHHVATASSVLSSHTAPSPLGGVGKKELVPILELNASVSGCLLVVYSQRHGMLFSCGCLGRRKDSSASTTVLMWLYNRGKRKSFFNQRAAQSFCRHEESIVDMKEVDNCLVTADESGVILITRLPDLTLQQTLIRGDLTARPIIAAIPFYGLTPAEAASTNDDEHCALAVATQGGCHLFKCVLATLREPLVLARYLPEAKSVVLVSAQRVSIWDAATGALRLQVDLSQLLSDNDDNLLSSHEQEDNGAASQSASTKPSEIVSASLLKHRLVIGDDRGGVHACEITVGALCATVKKLKELDPHPNTPITGITLLDANLCLTAGGATIACADESQPSYRREEAESAKNLSAFSAKSNRLRDTVIVLDEEEAVDVPKKKQEEKKKKKSITPTLSSSNLLLPEDEQEEVAAEAVVVHEVLQLAASVHLNLMATVATLESPLCQQVCLWDLELFTLVSSCSSSALLAGDDEDERTDRFTSVCFLEPYPVLAAATLSGQLHLWRVPDCEPIALFDPTVGPLATMLLPPRLKVLQRRLAEDTVWLAAGAETGHVAVFRLDGAFFEERGCGKVPPLRRRTYNLARQIHSQIELHVLLRSSKKDKTISATEEEDTAHVTRRWWLAHEDAEITALELSRDCTITCAEDGVTRLWSPDITGRFLGQLDPNNGRGNSRTWLFGRLSNDNESVAESLQRRASVVSMDSAAAPLKEQLPRLMVPDRANWDGVFETMVALEASFDRSLSAKSHPTSLGQGPNFTNGKHWRTTKSHADLAYLAPELPNAHRLCPPLSDEDARRARPKRHPLQKAPNIDDRISQRKAQIPRIRKEQNSANFPKDNDRNHLARIIKLRHMGL